MSYQDYMKIYENTRQRTTGVIYSLSHGRKQKLNELALAKHLEGTIKRIPYDVDKEKEELTIPRMFQKNGEVILLSRIDKITPTGSSLFGKATVDAPIRIRYRQKKILIVGTTDIFFLILRDIPSKKYFLVLFSSRTKSRELFEIFSENLKGLGLATSPCKIEHDDIQAITKKLKGRLKFTLIGNFPTPEITKKGIWGNNYENQQSYKDDIENGSIYQNQFQFRDRHNEEKVITVSDDALVRFYNNISYKDLEWFMREEIIPFVKPEKKTEIPSLMGFTFEDLFVYEE